MSVDRAVLFRLATSERLERAVRALPDGETLTWQAASRYVAGRSRGEALDTAGGLLVRGRGVSVDLFGELVRDAGTGRVLRPSTWRWRRCCHRRRLMCGWRWT